MCIRDRSNEQVSEAINNLEIVNDLIDIENRTNQLYFQSVQDIESVEEFDEKWKYLAVLDEVYQESLTLFGVFNLTKNDLSIMNDERRLFLIQDTLIEARQVYASMRIVVRRAIKESAKYSKTQKELEVFNQVFNTF